MMIRRSAALVALVITAACGGAPASNELRFNNDGNGRFSGSAGFDWTASEIQAEAQSQCGGPVTGFSVRTLDGGQVFSGQCASGTVRAVTMPATMTAPMGTHNAGAPTATTASTTTQPMAFPPGIPIPANSMDHR